MADYLKTPVLSKIKIGDSYYYLKDADARELLTTVVDTDIPAIQDDISEIKENYATIEYVDDQDAQVLVDAKAYTDEKIGDIILIKYEVVTELPTADADHEFNKSKTIYLKKEGTTGSDVYSEYICINQGSKDVPDYVWEKIGDTRIDLSNYYTKDEVDGLIEGVEALISAEETRATGVEDGLNTRLTTAEGEIDDLQAAVETIEGKPAYNITAQQITNWDNEVGAKAAVEAEVTRATGVEEGLDDRLTQAEADIDAIEAKEDSWDAKLNTVKINGQFKEVSTDTTNGNYVDLGQVATTDNTVNDVTYADATHTLSRTKNGVSAAVHVFGDLADENLANLEVKGQTVSGVKATGTSTGEIAVVLDQTSTAITSTGSVTADGSVTVDTTEVAASKVKTAGTVATFTEGAFTPNTPTVIDVSKFDGGSAATFTEGTFTPASLTYAASDSFCKEGLKAEVGTGADAECLIFTEVTNKGTASVISAFSGGSKAADTFNGGSAASLGTGFYTAGTAASKVADTFDGGAMPTFDEVKADKVGDATFIGSSVSVSVSGNYDKATVNAAGTKFTGKAIELNVGDIVVADKAVTKKA